MEWSSEHGSLDSVPNSPPLTLPSVPNSLNHSPGSDHRFIDRCMIACAGTSQILRIDPGASCVHTKTSVKIFERRVPVDQGHIHRKDRVERSRPSAWRRLRSVQSWRFGTKTEKSSLTNRNRQSRWMSLDKIKPQSIAGSVVPPLPTTQHTPSPSRNPTRTHPSPHPSSPELRQSFLIKRSPSDHPVIYHHIAKRIETTKGAQ